MFSGTQPPPYLIHEVNVKTRTDSKIFNVSLHSRRAEISRLYKLTLKAGQNQVFISGLPNVINQKSIRVEGHGAATIHDVSIAREIPEEPPQTSPKLEELQEKKDDIDKALNRCRQTLTGLGGYLLSVNAEHVKVADLLTIMDNYNTATAKYDSLESELKRELSSIVKAMDGERQILSDSVLVDTNLLMQATVGVFAEREGEVELIVIYAVSGASWTSSYDIRVNTQATDSPIELTYKAAVMQRTGESWQDIPLTFETANLGFGIDVPSLPTWSLSMFQPSVRGYSRSPDRDRVYRRRRYSRSPSRMNRPSSPSASSVEEEEDEDAVSRLPMEHAHARVISQGGINATFRVAGLISVPSDGSPHNVTIVKMTPEAKLSWLSIPNMQPRTHLTARIKNTSEYTLLSGASSVYIDGSFISKSTVPLVSPQESFTCPLGLDPSIRITYHPQVKKASQSGLITKTSSILFTQPITIHNSKIIPIDQLTIVDRIPVSQVAQIVVKLISPQLTLPAKPPAGLKAEVKAPPRVKVADGVFAQWHGTNEDGVAAESLGKDGKIDWVCSISPQKKVNLTLQWDVSMPVQAQVVGL